MKDLPVSLWRLYYCECLCDQDSSHVYKELISGFAKVCQVSDIKFLFELRQLISTSRTIYSYMVKVSQIILLCLDGQKFSLEKLFLFTSISPLCFQKCSVVGFLGQKNTSYVFLSMSSHDSPPYPPHIFPEVRNLSY